MPDLRPAYLGEVLGADVERMLVACFLHSRSAFGMDELVHERV
ncbi:MAG TPA: hypothetical protein VN961_21310 [Streptosporangiaceae bacterium]|nr:hypothetical protein [Streptosporangiaceae bacterium]